MIYIYKLKTDDILNIENNINTIKELEDKEYIIQDSAIVDLGHPVATYTNDEIPLPLTFEEYKLVDVLIAGENLELIEFDNTIDVIEIYKDGIATYNTIETPSHSFYGHNVVQHIEEL